MPVDADSASIVAKHGADTKPEKTFTTKEQSSFVNLALKVWELGKENARYYNSNRYLNMYFLLGKQWVYYCGTSQTIQPKAKKKGQFRLVFNRLFPYFKRQMNLLSRSQPLPRVLPNEDLDESRDLAEAARKITMYFWRHLRLKLVMQDLIRWFTVCNDGFLKVTWDTKSYVLDESGNSVPEGDVGVHVLSPFEVYYYPLSATKMSEVEIMLHAKKRSKEYCLDTWGDKAKNLETVPDSNNTYFDQHIANFKKFVPLSGTEQYKEKQEVWVLEVTQKASKKYPNGLLFTVAGGKLMEVKEKGNPYIEDGITENSFYDYIYFGDTKVPGRFWSTSAFEQAVPVQKEYNAERSLTIQNMRNMANLKFITPADSTITRVTDEPGEVIRYARRLEAMTRPPIEQLQMKPIPGYAARMHTATKEDMMDVLAQHDVSRGMAPPNIESGRGVAYLQAKDEEIASETSYMFIEGAKRLYQLILNRAHKYLDETRQGRIIGENNKIEFIRFIGSDIEDFNVDIDIQNESVFTELPSVKEQRIMSHYQSGLYGDPRDPKVRHRVLCMLETASEAIDFTKLDETYAEQENKMLMESDIIMPLPNQDPMGYFSVGGDQIVPTDYDNHLIHIEVHDRYIKENRFKEGVDKIKIQRLIDHSRIHKAMLGQAAMMMQQQGAPSPAGGQPTGGSPPKPPAGAGGGQPPMGGM